jgi:hypothetical protein
MTNEETYAELIRLLTTMGMTPGPAKQYAARAFQQGQVHSWDDGQVSTMIEGHIDSSPRALSNLAARIVGGAPAAERRGLSHEEAQALREEKLQRESGNYSF